MPARRHEVAAGPRPVPVVRTARGSSRALLAAVCIASATCSEPSSRPITEAVPALGTPGVAPPRDAEAAPPDDPQRALRERRRDLYRARLEREGRLAFLDLSYASPARSKRDSRWSQTDLRASQTQPLVRNRTAPGAGEGDGIQFRAAWGPDLHKPAAIEISAEKFPHRTAAARSRLTVHWEHAGFTCDSADSDRMLLGRFLTEKRRMKDVLETACVAPKRRRVGPCDGYASVRGTDSSTQQPTRHDLYSWTAGDATWLVSVTFAPRWLDDPGVAAKAEELIASFTALKPPGR